MGALWTYRAKFDAWLAVELAIILARCNLGIYPKDVYRKIKKCARFTVADVLARDAEINHDLQAFVDVVRLSLPLKLRRYFHEKVTSYDTEEPAQARILLKAGALIMSDLDRLIDVLWRQASEHMWTFCIAVTHGQDAQPTTLGWRFCDYLELFQRNRDNLRFILSQVAESKCSGAVGNNVRVSPELEAEIFRILHLKPRRVATQVVSRDVIARLMAELAVIAANMEKMAIGLRLLGLTANFEVLEPRRIGQKGSSAMPHKRNPVISEQITGLARVVRADSNAALENVALWQERDISHSSVERVILPDGFCLIDYMLAKATGVIGRLEINRKRMAHNIGRIYGCWASEDLKTLLCDKGHDPEEVYYYLQQACFEAMDNKRQLLGILLRRRMKAKRGQTAQKVTEQELRDCFHYRRPLRKVMPELYRRFNLDPKLALPPN
jgi:adenylosuccinate lyase